MLDLSYESAQNEVSFVKIEARVVDLCLYEIFEHKLPKTSFQVPHPQRYSFGIKICHFKINNILHKTSPYLQILNDLLVFYF